jgi:putative addiction module killer protein
MPAMREFEDEQGRSPFRRWFDRLAAPTAAKVTTALTRLEMGNTSALKAVGKGVSEVRIDFGPGFRIYVGQDGADLVILLGGSAKARQQQAIADAQQRWADYKARKRRGDAR